MHINSTLRRFVEANNSIYDLFAGLNLKDKACIDLSVGSPDLKPPDGYYHALDKAVHESKTSGRNAHGYISDYESVTARKNISNDLTDRFGLLFDQKHVIITAGATNALDVLLQTLIESPIAYDDSNNHYVPNHKVADDNGFNVMLDEVIMVAPYFVEYINLIKNNFAKPVIVPCNDTFDLDLTAIEKAVSPNTRAIIINSPNNPTGKIYSNHSLKELADLLKDMNNKYHIKIHVIEDSVYEALVFSSENCPTILPFYSFCFHISSFSKSLSIAGDRIGYLAVHPEVDPADWDIFRSGLLLNIRAKIVNAPGLQLKAISHMDLTQKIDTRIYNTRLNKLYRTLKANGFSVVPPEGAFYLWAGIPDEFQDENAFRALAFEGDDPLLYLPGYLFGGERYSRYIRLCVCTLDTDIERACDKIERIIMTATNG